MCRLGLPVQSRWTWTWWAPLAMPETETVTEPAPKLSEMAGAGGAGCCAGAGAGAGGAVGGAVGMAVAAGAAEAAGAAVELGWPTGRAATVAWSHPDRATATVHPIVSSNLSIVVPEKITQPGNDGRRPPRLLARIGGASIRRKDTSVGAGGRNMSSVQMR